MKRFISVVLAACCVFCLASCSDKADDGNALETANTVYDVTGEGSKVSVDENTAKTLLGAFSPTTLGIVNPIDEYTLKLGVTRLMGEDACMVEAYSDGSEAPEGVFAIMGTDCYVYDSKLERYLLLTTSGRVEIKETTTDSQSESAVFAYDKDNNTALQKRFSSYDIKDLGLKNKLSEYVLVMAGTTAVASDNETVYVVFVYDKNGKQTDVRLAFNENNDYIFNKKADKFEKI